MNKSILVCSGGGLKCLSFIGCLKALEENNVINNITTLAGSSSGGLILGFYSLGYSSNELIDIMNIIDIKKLTNLSIFNITNGYGLDNFHKIDKLIQKYIHKKGFHFNITLKELFEKTNKTLILTGTKLNTQECVYMSHKNYPNLELHRAVRITMSIPLYFSITKYDEDYYIDGSCTNNYPINIFSHELDNVVGIYLNQTKNKVKNINSLKKFFSVLGSSLMVGLNNNILNGYEEQTILVDVNLSNSLISISVDDKLKLYEIGYETVINYLKNKIL